ncbi:hypothetical protein ASD07_12095 [Duganella sp. Root336D2]|nr:hypothetical protein ASD07_12095 [Duganella sp. Root336D2]
MLSALALLACTAHAQNAPMYRAVKFDAQFRPQVLNDLGQVAGIGQDGKPAIWHPDGSILHLPGTASEVTITGFNNQGTVVGNALIPGYSLPQPVVWRNGGSVERLHFSGIGGYTEAYAGWFLESAWESPVPEPAQGALLLAGLALLGSLRLRPGRRSA